MTVKLKRPVWKHKMKDEDGKSFLVGYLKAKSFDDTKKLDKLFYLEHEKEVFTIAIQPDKLRILAQKINQLADEMQAREPIKEPIRCLICGAKQCDQRKD